MRRSRLWAVGTFHWFVQWPFTELAPLPAPLGLRSKVTIFRNNKLLDPIFSHNMKTDKEGTFMNWCKWTSVGRNKTLLLQDRYVLFAAISCNTNKSIKQRTKMFMDLPIGNHFMENVL